MSQLLLCACKGRFVMSFRAGIMSDVVDVLRNGGGPRHSTSNVSVMLLPVCRSPVLAMLTLSHLQGSL